MSESHVGTKLTVNPRFVIRRSATADLCSGSAVNYFYLYYNYFNGFPVYLSLLFSNYASKIWYLVVVVRGTSMLDVLLFKDIVIDLST